jgi:hypothetical protein
LYNKGFENSEVFMRDSIIEDIEDIEDIDNSSEEISAISAENMIDLIAREDSEDDILNNSDTETDSVDSEDFHGASFEDAVNGSRDNSAQQWPNDIYQEFAKLCVNNDLSNQAIDSFIHFFNNNANLKESPLPKNSKAMHKFMNSMLAPNLDFKSKHIIEFENVSYILHYRPIIKTIKALFQKPEITKDFAIKFEKKQKMNTVSNHHMTHSLLKCIQLLNLVLNIL